MKICCFIFARAGSKRLKNKNMKKFCGKPLIFHSINFAKKYFKTSRVYVSTDSNIIKNYAKRLNVNVIDRPKKLARDNSEEFLAWKHAVNTVEKEGTKFDIFLSLPSTAPLRSYQDVKKCLKKLKSKNEIIVTCFKSEFPTNIRVKKSLNKYFYIHGTRSKRMSYQLTTSAYVTTPKYIKKSSRIFSGKLKLSEVPLERSIDINNIFDFKFAEVLSKNKLV